MGRQPANKKKKAKPKGAKSAGIDDEDPQSLGEFVAVPTPLAQPAILKNSPFLFFFGLSVRTAEHPTFRLPTSVQMSPAGNWIACAMQRGCQFIRRKGEGGPYAYC
jgi:hypothetical protein